MGKRWELQFVTVLGLADDPQLKTGSSVLVPKQKKMVDSVRKLSNNANSGS